MRTLSFLAWAALAASATAAPPQYQIYDIGVTQVSDTASQGFGVSSAGAAVGRSVRANGSQAIVWTLGGGLLGMPNLPGRIHAVANDANDNGVLVGTAATTLFGSSRLPVIWSNSSVFQLPLPAGQTLGDANGVNASGVAVGSVDGGISQRGVIYNGGSATIITQTTPGGSFFVTAFGINDSGRIVGQGIDPNNAARNVGIVYDMGSSNAFEVDPLPGFNGALAFAVGNSGHVVGSSMLNQGSGLPFIWSSGTGSIAIPLATGTSQGSARGVNSAGWVVGQDSSAFSIPFLWDGTMTYRLADLLPPGSGWDLSMNTSSSALGISDNGVIVGTGVHNGETRAYAMVPVKGATHFEVIAPPAVIQFTGFNFTVRALDQFNNTVTNYPGTVHFTTTSVSYILPPDGPLTNGFGTFSADLHTLGIQTITATDTVNASITGTSNNIMVLSDQPTPPPTPTATATATATPTSTASPIATVTPTASPTPSSIPTPPITPAPTSTATSSPTPTPPASTQALNISTRLLVQTGENVGIGGFIVTGTAPKHVILRGIGPSLSGAGVSNALSNPTLDLRDSNGVQILANDNWRDTQEKEIAATGIAPADDLEAAIVETLEPGSYTVILRGMGMTSGVGLVEIYDLDPAAASRLANLSTRGFVGTGSDIVIAGFILGGEGDDRVVVRGLGPSLGQAGVTDALPDPMLELRDSNGTLLMGSNDWQENLTQAAELIALGLAPSNDLESGIVATLSPGLYTALLSGVNNGTGVGVVEVYDLGPP